MFPKVDVTGALASKPAWAATPLLVDPTQAWILLLALLAVCCTVLYLLTKPGGRGRPRGGSQSARPAGGRETRTHAARPQPTWRPRLKNSPA
ncbi:MAG: hypothetical protein ABSA52_21025 [Candidatus Binatia bacterium]|jgi:hypothetical protein